MTDELDPRLNSILMIQQTPSTTAILLPASTPPPMRTPVQMRTPVRIRQQTQTVLSSMTKASSRS